MCAVRSGFIAAHSVQFMRVSSSVSNGRSWRGARFLSACLFIQSSSRCRRQSTTSSQSLADRGRESIACAVLYRQPLPRRTLCVPAEAPNAQLYLQHISGVRYAIVVRRVSFCDWVITSCVRAGVVYSWSRGACLSADTSIEYTDTHSIAYTNIPMQLERQSHVWCSR